jgi:hypothetical protein
MFQHTGVMEIAQWLTLIALVAMYPIIYPPATIRTITSIIDIDIEIVIKEAPNYFLGATSDVQILIYHALIDQFLNDSIRDSDIFGMIVVIAIRITEWSQFHVEVV